MKHALRRSVFSAVLASVLAFAPGIANAGDYHGYGYQPGYSVGFGYHGGGGDLLAGLIIGSVVGYLLTRPYYAPPPPPRAYAYPSYRLTRAPRYVSTAPAATPVRPDCIQTREYQTTVVIDGEAADAYGTRCLRTDGTWVFGPPKLAPRFD